MSEPELQTAPTHVIDTDDLTAWLAEYGLRADDLLSVSVNLGWSRGHVNAWLDVEWYKRDAVTGQKYVDPDDRERAATATACIPLHSWPQLVQVRHDEHPDVTQWLADVADEGVTRDEVTP